MGSTAPEQAPAIDAQITEFRQTYSEALTNAGHMEHSRRVDELTAMYQAKHGETPDAPAPKPSLADLTETPLAPDQYDIGPQSHFGMNAPQAAGWDTDTETQARTWMAAAGLPQSGAQALAHAYVEVQQETYKPDTAAAMSAELIGKAYPGEADAAVTAMQRLVLESGGESLKQWLNDTGLGNHPLLVREVLNLAEKRGYIARKVA